MRATDGPVWAKEGAPPNQRPAVRAVAVKDACFRNVRLDAMDTSLLWKANFKLLITTKYTKNTKADF